MDKKQFLKQLLYIFLFLILVFILTNLWLKSYTNHGQKLKTPDYVDQEFTQASKDAKDKSFDLVVNDSVHIVGKEGGVVISQNPIGGAEVKENRKIYVTITKYQADTWKFDDLPALYGSDYDQKRRELSFMEINTNVKGYKYDSGEPNHILEVWYNDKIISSRNIERSSVEIEKGGTLEFVLSEQAGGQTTIPDLVCSKVQEARDILYYSKLKLGVISGGDPTGGDEYYIVSQDPPYVPSENIKHGATINIQVQRTKPEGCN